MFMTKEHSLGLAEAVRKAFITAQPGTLEGVVEQVLPKNGPRAVDSGATQTLRNCASILSHPDTGEALRKMALAELLNVATSLEVHVPEAVQTSQLKMRAAWDTFRGEKDLSLEEAFTFGASYAAALNAATAQPIVAQPACTQCKGTGKVEVEDNETCCLQDWPCPGCAAQPAVPSP
jgi:hypothetical protein